MRLHRFLLLTSLCIVSLFLASCGKGVLKTGWSDWPEKFRKSGKTAESTELIKHTVSINRIDEGPDGPRGMLRYRVTAKAKKEINTTVKTERKRKQYKYEWYPDAFFIKDRDKKRTGRTRWVKAKPSVNESTVYEDMPTPGWCAYVNDQPMLGYYEEEPSYGNVLSINLANMILPAGVFWRREDAERKERDDWRNAVLRYFKSMEFVPDSENESVRRTFLEFQVRTVSGDSANVEFGMCKDKIPLWTVGTVSAEEFVGKAIKQQVDRVLNSKVKSHTIAILDVDSHVPIRGAQLVALIKPSVGLHDFQTMLTPEGRRVADQFLSNALRQREEIHNSSSSGTVILLADDYAGVRFEITHQAYHFSAGDITNIGRLSQAGERASLAIPKDAIGIQMAKLGTKLRVEIVK